MTFFGSRKAAAMLAGGLMHHDWVFDVLQDMLSYATLNGLPRLAERVAEAIEVAREEIGSPGGPDDPAGNPPETPPSGDRKMH